MMTKTTLSDGRRTRPRFAAPTPTPPKFLIGTDDPARIGILPVLRREGSDQQESKGFGWDPAKTLRMAEPPEFLIGTIEQSENHSTPAKQTTNPNPNGTKYAFRIRRSEHAFRVPILRRAIALSPCRIASGNAEVQSRTTCAAPPAQAFRVESIARLHTFCAASPAQAQVAEGTRLSHPPRHLSAVAQLRLRNVETLLQSRTACAASPAQASHALACRALVPLASGRPFEVLATSRPSSGLLPLAQHHPRKKTSGGIIPSINDGQTSSLPFAQLYPRKPLVSGVLQRTAGCRTLPYLLRWFTRATSRARVRALRKVKKAGRMPALQKSISNRYTAIRNSYNHTQN